MPQTSAEIIVAAWARERDNWSFRVKATKYDDGTSDVTARLVSRVNDDDFGFSSPSSCQAHLDQLCAAAVERALAEAGYVIVPREPTEAMLDAGFNAVWDHVHTGHNGEAGLALVAPATAYRAMLAAAPEGER